MKYEIVRLALIFIVFMKVTQLKCISLMIIHVYLTHIVIILL